MKIVLIMLENFCLNLIMLKTTTLMLSEKGNKFWLSALLGAGMTAMLTILNLNVVGWVLFEVGQVFVVICISFKFADIKKFCLLFFAHFLCAFIYGGACFFAQQFLGNFPLYAVLLVVVCTYVAFRLVFARLRRKRAVENFCCDVELEKDGRVTKWKAFLDSGNLLFDPLTHSPVSLVNFRVFSTLFSQIELADVLCKSEKLRQLPLAHYVSFNTLGEGSKILVFQVDRLSIGGQVLEKPTLGLSFKDFTFGTDVILHNNLAFV